MGTGPGPDDPDVAMEESYMHRGWRGAVLAALLGLGGAASAHEFDCQKSINGQAVLNVSEFPATLRFNQDKNNWSPRFGFTYDMGGNHTSIVKGGYGIYFGRTSNSVIRANRNVAASISSTTYI